MDIRELREVCATLIPYIENVEYSKPTPKSLLLALLERAIILIDDYGKLELVQFLNEDLYSLVKTGSKTDSRVSKFKSDHFANTCELLLLVNKKAEVELIKKKLPRNLVLRDSGSKGGAKNKQFHFFEFESDNSNISDKANEIYYDVVELPQAKWWVKPFTQFVFDGRKKWLFIIAPVAIFIFFIVGFYYYLQITPAPIYLLSYLSLIFIFILIYYIAKPFYLTLDNSIAIVSNWMLRISQRSGQVEMHYLDKEDDNGFPLREIRLSIYSAKCPICGGKVFIDNGKNEFKGRLIGKCRKAQTEHIYSFDHIKKEGRLLR
jgi:hypothetical protein